MDSLQNLRYAACECVRVLVEHWMLERWDASLLDALRAKFAWFQAEVMAEITAETLDPLVVHREMRHVHAVHAGLHALKLRVCGPRVLGETLVKLSVGLEDVVRKQCTMQEGTESSS